ncbi:MAG: hypothetical protein WCL38_05510 [Actinomycetota bacterium]
MRRQRLRTQKRLRGDNGAVLIMAMAFLLAASVVGVSLLTWTETSILSDQHNAQAAALQNATGAAVQAEMEALRYNYQVVAKFPLDPITNSWDCTPKGNNLPAVGGQVVIIACRISFQSDGRVIDFSACKATYKSTALADCITYPFLSAQVKFYDVSLTSVLGCTGPSNAWSCGTGLTINRWQFVS